MNDRTRVDLLESLLSRRQAIAETWYDSIASQCFERLDPLKMQPHFVGLTEQMMTLLLSKPLERAQAQEIGIALNHLGLNAKAIVRTQEVLAQQMTQALPPEQLLLLQPQLVGLLGEIARGFFEEKAEKAETRGQLTREFLISMRHELRTPFGSIIGYAKVILMGLSGPLNDDLRDDLTAISSSGQYLLKMINDILYVAELKADYKDTHLELTTFDVIGLIKDIAFSFPNIYHNTITVAVDCPLSLGSMHADQHKIKHVLESLLREAVGSDEIRFTGWRDSSEDREWICFQITGLGHRIWPLEVDRLKTLFSEKVEQAKLLDSIKYGRYKFTMEVTHHLCQFMGGTISVEHEADKGITFIVRLPIEHIGSPLVIGD